MTEIKKKKAQLPQELRSPVMHSIKNGLILGRPFPT